jgi:predicted TIM-barrel fold metal-dependent hydrolase
MIIDCHAHVFQNWAGLCGHESREVQLKYMQKTVTRPAAEIRRARDGARATGQFLFDPADNSWAGLREDVGFRVGPYGRLEFTVQGEDYYVQYMPVGMAQIEAPPELQLAQMLYAGVDHAVLQAGMTYGVMNDFNAFCQSQHPHKFTGLMHVNEPLADTPRWIEELQRARNTLSLCGLYYQVDAFSRYGFQWGFDDPRFDEFWEAVADMHVPVFIECSSGPDYTEKGYLTNLLRLDRLLARFPQMRWLLVMGPPVGFFAKHGTWEFPADVQRIYARENLQLEVMFPITWGGVWDYPYPEAQALIRDLRDRFGADKLIWGSDMPNVERFCTYRQCVDYVRRYCEFLTAGEKDRILGENVAELCGIES